MLPKQQRAVAWALAALCLASLAGCRSAAWAPDSKTVALDAGGKLRLFNVATSQFTTLDTGGRFVVNPCFSPDGRMLAYYGITSQDGKPQGADLWVRDLGTNQERKIASAVADLDAMSTEGVPGGDEAAKFSMGIKLMLQVSWSPDGTRLVHSRVRKETGQIELTDVASGKSVPLGGADQEHYYPVWAPKGEMIAFLSMPKNVRGSGKLPGSDLYVMNASGNSVKRLWDSSKQPGLWPFGRPTWSSDGTNVLALTGRKSGNAKASQNPMDQFSAFDARVIPVAGGASRVLTQFTTPFGEIAPDLKSILYLGGSGDPTLVFKSAPFKTPKILDKMPQQSMDLSAGQMPTTMLIPFPVLSPDGKTVVMPAEDAKAKRQEVRLYEVATGKKTVHAIP
jgi:Tol biopolymer transport system component